MGIARRILAFLILASAFAAADSRIECKAVRSAILHRQVRYCAILPESYDQNPAQKYPIVYFLHGIGDNERSITGPFWNIVEDLRSSKKIGEFLIVTPAADSTFYVNARDGQPRYEDFFIREFIPAIEKRYRVVGGAKARGISGLSMGGYGALRLGFKYPEMFAAISAHMPALYAKLPPQVIEQLNRISAGTPLTRIFGQPFDEKFWERNTPFFFARANAARLRNDKIYFDCGDHDDFGFDAGTRELDQLLTSLKVPHEAHIYPGRHDPVFIVDHLGQSMAFQSKALGAK